MWLKRLIKTSSFRAYLTIFIFAAILLLPLFKNGILYTDDVDFHERRYIGTLNALKDGQILPQVDPSAVGGFGNGVNIFYGPFSSYISVIFRAITPNWAFAINLMFYIFVVFSGIAMYRLIRETAGGSHLPALIAALFYMSMPYHLNDIFLRHSPGELLAFGFLPLIILGLLRIFNNRKYAVPLLTISAAGLIISHTVSAFIVAGFALIFCAVNYKKLFQKSVFPKLLLSIIFTLSLSAFFLLPLLEAKSNNLYNIFNPDFLTHNMAMNADFLEAHTLTPANLIFGSASSSGAYFFAIGACSSAVIVIALFFFKKLSRFSKVLLILGLVSLALTTPIVPWRLVPSIFYSIQFPWRLLLISSFCLSAVAGEVAVLVFTKLSRRKFSPTAVAAAISFILLLVSSPILVQADNAPVHAVVPTNDIMDVDNINSYLKLGISGAEYFPESFKSDYFLEPLKNRGDRPLALPGSAAIFDYKKTGTHLDFDISSVTATTIELPLVYYSGYAATSSNGAHIEVSPSPLGLVQLVIPSGELHISVHFAGSAATHVGIIISVMSLCALAGFIFFSRHQVPRSNHNTPLIKSPSR
jgi:hypothetical protein